MRGEPARAAGDGLSTADWSGQASQVPLPRIDRVRTLPAATSASSQRRLASVGSGRPMAFPACGCRRTASRRQRTSASNAEDLWQLAPARRPASCGEAVFAFSRDPAPPTLACGLCATAVRRMPFALVEAAGCRRARRPAAPDVIVAQDQRGGVRRA